MNKEKRNTALPLVLGITTSLIYLMLLFLIGRLINKVLTINILPFSIALVIFTFLFSFANVLVGNYIEKKLNKMNHQEQIDYLLSKKQWLKNNVLEVRNLAIKKQKKCLAYGICSIILLNLSFLVSCIACDFNNEESIVLPLISIGIFLPLLYNFFYKRYDSIINKDKEELSTNYKKVNEFVGEVFKEEGITLPVKVDIMFDVNCGISKTKNGLYLCIGLFCLRCLSNDELKAVLLHEIAHFKNKDLEYAGKIEKYNKTIDILFPLKAYRFLCPFLASSVLDNSINDILVNEYFEKKADDEVIKRNMNQDYANATIKMFGISKANDLKYPFIEYEVAKNKKWDEKTINDDLNARLDYYNAHKDFFEFVSKNHADERFATHPNINQRRKMCNVKDVDLEITINHFFDDDIKEYYEISNKTCFKEDNKDLLKYYDEYFSLKDSDTNDLEQLNKILEMAYDLGDYENVLRICSKFISLNDNRNRMNFYYGTVLLMVYFNKEGIKYLNKVIEDNNNEFKLDAMHYLGDYYAMVGNEDKLNEIRNIQVNILNQSDEMEDVLSLKPTDRLTEFTNEEVKNNIINILKDNEDVLYVLMGVKTVKDVSCCHVIVFGEINLKDVDKFNEDLNKVFNYLDVLEDQYSLNSYPINVFKAAPKVFKDALIVYKKEE